LVGAAATAAGLGLLVSATFFGALVGLGVLTGSVSTRLALLAAAVIRGEVSGVFLAATAGAGGFFAAVLLVFFGVAEPVLVFFAAAFVRVGLVAFFGVFMIKRK